MAYGMNEERRLVLDGPLFDLIGSDGLGGGDDELRLCPLLQWNLILAGSRIVQGMDVIGR